MIDRRRHSSGTTWEGEAGCCRAVRAGDWILVSGTTAAAEGGGATSADPRLQTLEALRRVREALAALGGSLDDVVRSRLYVTDLAHWQEIGRAHSEVLGWASPAMSMVQIDALVDPELVVAVEVDAFTAR